MPQAVEKKLHPCMKGCLSAPVALSGHCKDNDPPPPPPPPPQDDSVSSEDNE